MTNNANGMVKLNVNVIDRMTVPAGFLVREKIVDNTPVSLEYGIYLSNDIFLGIPIHFSLKDKLVPAMDLVGFKFYYVPENMQFAVTTYKSKKTGKVNPLLVAPTEENPAVLITSFAFGNLRDTVIDLKITDESKVLRKFIDKDRKMVGVIMCNTDSACINPTTTFELTYGQLNSRTKNVSKYTFGSMIAGGVEVVTTEESTDEPLKTNFIYLPTMIGGKSKTVKQHI